LSFKSLFLSAPVNLLSYYLFHKKFFAVRDQKILWEKRSAEDCRVAIEERDDPYYKWFDEYVLNELKEFDTSAYLEVGCYFGKRLNKFSGYLPDRRFGGLELGFENIRLGKKYILKDTNIFLINANACAIPLKDRSIETIYTVVCLTHIDYASIGLAIDEMIRVCGKNLFLIEVDHRSMRLKKKIECLNWRYGYMHPYEKIVGNRMNLLSVTPLHDKNGHPRYTAFKFIRADQ